MVLDAFTMEKDSIQLRTVVLDWEEDTGEGVCSRCSL